MQITWLGHASFKIKTKDKVIYIDPYFGEYDESADIILISHNHYDHVSMEKVNQIRVDATQILTTAEVVSTIYGATTLTDNVELNIDSIKINTVPMYSRTHTRGNGLGFIITSENISVYFAGDADLIPEIAQIKADIALLPVGGTYTMNAKEAAQAAIQIKPKLAIPMHFGSGIVGTIDDAELFKELVESRSDVKVRILKHGEIINI
ncbi:MAG: MBL fold metallo-hydrolase [Nanoarchaeota archaeon]